MNVRESNKQGFHTFMERHAPNYKKTHAEDYINAYLFQIGYYGNKGFTEKMKMIQKNFKGFREWFFRKNRIRIKHERLV